MTLASRLTDLVAAIGADVKQLFGQTDLPSYAPRTSKNSYDPKFNMYNLKGSNTRKAHAGMIRAQNGGKFNILAIGDSVLVGYDGTASVCPEWRSIPRQVGRYFAQSLNVPEAGGMIPVGVATNLLESGRNTYTGTITSSAGGTTMSAGATATHKMEKAATTAEVFYSDLSTAFTVSIDGATPVTVTPTGTAAMRRYQVTGLQDMVHTIKVTCLTNWAFISFFGSERATGVKVDNIALGGTRAGSGGPVLSWQDTTNASNVQAWRKGSFDTQSVVPDLVIVSLGGNDMAASVLPDDFATQFAVIRSWYPNSDFLFLLSLGLTTITQANWDAFCTRMYQMADDLDIPLMDLRDRCGFATEAISNGLIGVDGYHETAGAMFDWARAITLAYSGISKWQTTDNGNVDRDIPTGYMPPTGSWTMPSNCLQTANGVPVSGQTTFWPVDVGPKGLDIQSLGVQVSVARVGGTVVEKLALYLDDGTGGSPVLTTAGIIASGTVSFAATGKALLNLTQNLKPGRYWLACFYYASVAPTTNPQLVCCANATALWTTNTLFTTVARYLRITGGTNLPVANEALGPGADSLGPVVCMRAA